MTTWQKGSPRTQLVGMEFGTAILEDRMEILQKTKNINTIQSDNPTKGIKTSMSKKCLDSCSLQHY
jgi:hypothetical protein